MDKKYIEREAVVELLNKWADGYSYIEVPTKDAIACVRVIPAADVVPVVRCGECEWWTKQDSSCQGRCALFGIYPTGAWYCANGAKMDGDGE